MAHHYNAFNMNERFIEALNQQLEQSPLTPVIAKKLWVNLRMSLRTTKYTKIILLNARYCFSCDKEYQPLPIELVSLLAFIEEWADPIDWNAMLMTLDVIVREAKD